MNRLKELRQEKKLSQKELAENIGVHYRTLQNWENGESQIKPEKAQILADHFGVSVGFLLGYESNEQEYLPWEDELKKLRTGKGITQEELAQLLNFPVSLIQAWENEQQGYTKKQLQALADYFGVSPSQVLGLRLGFDVLDDKQNESDLLNLYRTLDDKNKERLMVYANDLYTLQTIKN